MQTHLPMSDEARQARIDTLSIMFQAAKTAARRRVIWEEIRELIRGRSPETVEKMEIERGLRK